MKEIQMFNFLSVACVLIFGTFVHAQTDCQAPVNEAPVNEVSTNLGSLEASKEVCQNAIKRILAENPTTLKGDILREIAAIATVVLVASIYRGIVPKTEKAEQVEKIGRATINIYTGAVTPGQAYKTTETEEYYVLEPAVLCLTYSVVRFLFDKKIRKTGNFDSDLDLLVSHVRTNPEVLMAMDFDLEGVKKKIDELSNKCEWARWIYRFIVVCLALMCSVENFADGCLHKALTVGFICSAFLYLFVIPSATVKKMLRTEKLNLIKDFIACAKVYANKNEVAA